MALKEEDIAGLRKVMEGVADEQIKRLNKEREVIRSIKEKARPLPHYSANAVAFVAADGGNNVVNFGGGGASGGRDGALAHLVRVVDSNGNPCALEAMPAELEDDFFDKARNEPMRVLCKALRRKPSDLSRFFYKGKDSAKNYRIAAYRVEAYREVVEWAVLYEFLTRKQNSDVILVREGGLSTTVFEREVFDDLESLLREECEKRRQEKNNVFLVGVSKRTVLLRILSVALSFENIFAGNGPRYAPAETRETRELYTSPPSYFGMGVPFFVRFGDSPFDPIWRVDVAKWQKSEKERILGILANDARIGFPIPDFPMCVQQAHNYANIGGLELAYIKGIMMDEMIKRMDEKDREKMLRSLFLREDLFGGRYRRG